MWLPLSLALCLPLGQTSPPPIPPEIARAIEDLGEGNFKTREKAAEFLWKQGRDAEKRLKIISIHHDHPDWSYRQIGDAAGVTAGHVCRILKPLREQERHRRKERMARGAKDREGHVEAWAE